MSSFKYPLNGGELKSVAGKRAQTTQSVAFEGMLHLGVSYVSHSISGGGSTAAVSSNNSVVPTPLISGLELSCVDTKFVLDLSVLQLTMQDDIEPFFPSLFSFAHGGIRTTDVCVI
jgi:hypothetical protein